MKPLVTVLAIASLFGPALPAAAAPGSLYSPQFDSCVKHFSGRFVELASCYGEEHKLQDARLNSNYKMAMSSLSLERQAQLRDAQRKWIKYRDSKCKAAGDPDGGHIGRIEGMDCFLSTTAERANELGAVVGVDSAAAAPVQAPPATGLGAWPSVLTDLAKSISACRSVPGIERTINELKAARLIDPRPTGQADQQEAFYRLNSPVALGGVTFDRVVFYGADDSGMGFAGLGSTFPKGQVAAALKAAGLRTETKAKLNKPEVGLTGSHNVTHWLCGVMVEENVP